MANTAIRKDDGIGVAIAIALHAVVLGAMLFRADRDVVVKPPQRIEVTISNEVGLTSTSPSPASKTAPDRAPQLGEAAPEAATASEAAPASTPPSPQPREIETTRPDPAPKASPEPAPKPAPTAKAKPKAKPSQTPKPDPKPSSRPKRTEQAPPKKVPSRKTSAIDNIISTPNKTGSASPSKSASSSSTASPSKSSAPPKKSGASSFADAFGEGQPGAKSSSGTDAPAAAIGPKQVSALVAAINRQLKPHWQAPQGADADLLVTRLRFRLNRDGSLAGEPQVISTTGQNAANQTQVQRHQEQAVRAVKLAAPFNLPDDLYEGWKVITTNFDRRLSQ